MEPIEAERRASSVIQRMSVVGFPQHPEFEELHERHGFGRIYTVGRSGPAGGGPRTATAVLGLFPHSLLVNAFTRIAEDDDVDRVRSAHVAASAQAGERLYGDLPAADELADRLEGLIDVSDFSARTLAATWADLPRPDGVGARVERAATVVREHRGGGHVAVLTTHGMTGPDALLVTALWREHGEVEGNARFFGWRDDDIERSWGRLEASGRVDADHALTDTGREEREAIEDLTTSLATPRWEGLDAGDRARLVELLGTVPSPG